MLLSQEDIDRLLREDSADTRVDITNKISASYNTHALSDHERMYAEQIFRLLMKDTERKVRENLASALKENPDVPRDVILSLVNDEPPVSVPVLEASQVLSDADLIRIIETSRDTGKLSAVARRPEVSGRVSTALVETSYPQVVSTLLQNEGARMTEKHFSSILEQFPDNEHIHEKMITRANLPVNVAASLLEVVSDSYSEMLHERFGDALDKTAQQLKETLTLDLISYNSTEEDVDALVQNMARQGSLSVSILFSSLCRGYLSFFTIALSRMAGIPKSNAFRLVEDPGKKGFQALYEKTELPESMYDAIRLLLDIVLDMRELEDYKPGTSRYCDRVITELAGRSESAEVDNLSYVIALVRNAARH
jgi:uncharacterized protein (DUF2336 family)